MIEEAEVEESRRVRPYALTGGRTRSKVELSMETLVRSNARGLSARYELQAEEARILDLAREPISVAEISAHLGVVLGVARVLVGDLVAAGRLDRNAPAEPTVPEYRDVKLLGRVLDGLRTL